MGFSLSFCWSCCFVFVVWDGHTQSAQHKQVHYVVYPKALRWYGALYAWLNVTYDVWARKAFLQTIKPKNVFEQLFARSGRSVASISTTRTFSPSKFDTVWMAGRCTVLQGAQSGVVK